MNGLSSDRLQDVLYGYDPTDSFCSTEAARLLINNHLENQRILGTPHPRRANNGTVHKHSALANPAAHSMQVFARRSLQYV